MTRKALSTVVALVLAVIPLAGVQSGPPGDGEIRTARDPSTNESVTTLTLMLSGPKGSLPVNLGFAVVRAAGASAASKVRIDVNMGLFVGELDTKTPHVVFMLDRSSKTVEANVDAATVLPGRKFIQVPFDAGRLKSLASATNVAGRVFGVEFVFTPKQISAIKQFAAALK